MGAVIAIPEKAVDAALRAGVPVAVINGGLRHDDTGQGGRCCAARMGRFR